MIKVEIINLDDWWTNTLIETLMPMIRHGVKPPQMGIHLIFHMRFYGVLLAALWGTMGWPFQRLTWKMARHGGGGEPPYLEIIPLNNFWCYGPAIGHTYWPGLLLGGELPTNRGRGWTFTPIISGHCPHKNPIYNWGELTHLWFVGSSPPSSHSTLAMIPVLTNPRPIPPNEQPGSCASPGWSKQRFSCKPLASCAGVKLQPTMKLGQSLSDG